MSDPINLAPDLDRLETTDSARMSVRDPGTGEVLTDPDGTEWYIELWGEKSAVAREFEDQLDRRRRQKGSRDWTMAELREISLDRMTALTRDWYLRRSGEGVPCDAKTVRAVYERWPWLMKQAAAFANQEANFLGESEPS